MSNVKLDLDICYKSGDNCIQQTVLNLFHETSCKISNLHEHFVDIVHYVNLVDKHCLQIRNICRYISNSKPLVAATNLRRFEIIVTKLISCTTRCCDLVLKLSLKSIIVFSHSQCIDISNSETVATSRSVAKGGAQGARASPLAITLKNLRIYHTEVRIVYTGFEKQIDLRLCLSKYLSNLTTVIQLIGEHNSMA